eukprot:TRINITY_DN2449_c0_g1_i1.p1 TRINITY_DN2449_c0_g1~~TRINITY_DN2449_c0_g1_i1.p1  ORF type:complete len:626 (+),score=105.80 TRINITY_DN2449_c0_g1_i1:90-1967(+)
MGKGLMKGCAAYCVVCGLFSIGLGIFIFAFANSKLLDAYADAVKIKPTDYSGWANTKAEDSDTIHKYHSISFWSLTNPTEFMNGAKPVMKEYGPYQYVYRSIKYNISFSSDSNRVRFQTYSYWQFDRTKTASNLDPDNDKLLVVNPAYAYVIESAGTEQNLMFMLADVALRGAWDKVTKSGQPISTVAALWRNATTQNLGALTLPFAMDQPTAEAFVTLFNSTFSSTSGTLAFLGSIGPALYTMQSNQTKALQMLADVATKFSMPASYFQQHSYSLYQYLFNVGKYVLKGNFITSGATGLFLQRTPTQILFNNTDGLIQQLTGSGAVAPFTGGLDASARLKQSKLQWDKYYLYRTGMDDAMNIELIETFAGKTTVKYWKSELNVASEKGRDGGRFQNHLKNKWSADEKIRVFTDAVWRGVDMLYDKDLTTLGLKLKRYAIAEYELQVNDKFYITYNQVANMTGPSGGLPLFVSRPHFYKCDASLLNTVGGLSPGPQHELYLDVEPITGMVLGGHKRIQQNVYVKRQSLGPVSMNATFTSETGPILIPWFWVDENAELTQNVADKLVKVLYGIRTLLRIILGVLVGVGAAMAIGGTIMCVMVMRGKAKTSSSISYAQPVYVTGQKA